MVVIELLNAATGKRITINKVIIWNPNTSRALYVGQINEIPNKLKNKNVEAYFYNKEKERMIIRV